MNENNGSVSINTENIFPIIKKWLYSEKDIFIREIISNAGDAISKLRKLDNIGEAEIEDSPEWRITVVVDKEHGTITVSDNGIGMTGEEVGKYINQIAFSGAKDFIEKYKGKADEEQIIGHFGLGFYSSFMVSTKVEIDTKSFIAGEKAVHWESEDGMNYSITDSELDERGTYITMHIAEDSAEFLDIEKLKSVIEKYFSFFPYEIYVESAEELEKEDQGDIDQSSEEKDAAKEIKPINDTHPLWLKAARDVTDEEYKEFYKKTFKDFEDPLFWIHLNVDYPFNLKGILYFPKLRDRYERFDGQIKVYYNQVFVAENIKEVLPEFLMLLKGVIDCPDLPLNVSRSFLQNDGYVAKISSHITKKVTDKLTSLFNEERENYCKYWDDIHAFVKYGCLTDEKLYDKIKDIIIYKTVDGGYYTASEYLEKTKEKTDGKTIFYTEDADVQNFYIKLLADREIPSAVMNTIIDSSFMQYVEYTSHGDIKFARVDSEVASSVCNSKEDQDEENVKEIVTKLTDCFKKASGNDKLTVEANAIDSGLPGILILSEQTRRFQEMMKRYGTGDTKPSDELTLCINAKSPVIAKLLSLVKENKAEIKDAGTDRSDEAAQAAEADQAAESDQAAENDQSAETAKAPEATFSDEALLLARQIYDLALLAHRPLDKDRMNSFLADCADILNKAF